MKILDRRATEAAAEVQEANARSVTRALVVDDDPDINRLVVMRLKTRGFTVESAVNGQEALDTISDRPPALQPDLIFTDVSMPVMGGLDLLAHIRQMDLDVAVIMMTAFGSEGVAIDALRRGADDYLRKPFERDEFQAVLERTVAHLELRRQNTALRLQLDERRRQLEAELARAGKVQLELLPHDMPHLPGFDLAAACVPAREVGGDFYDWQLPDDGILRLTLGDVMGKGMPAALVMATARAALRAVASEAKPEVAVQRAAEALEPDLDRSSSFLTLFRAHLDPPSGTLRYVDAGHGLAFLRRSDGSVEELQPRGIPLGVLPGTSREAGSVVLHPGDWLVLYSDGLPDSRPDSDIGNRTLADVLSGSHTAKEAVSRLLSVADTSSALPDDLTVIALYCRE